MSPPRGQLNAMPLHGKITWFNKIAEYIRNYPLRSYKLNDGVWFASRCRYREGGSPQHPKVLSEIGFCFKKDLTTFVSCPV